MIPSGRTRHTKETALTGKCPRAKLVRGRRVQTCNPDAGTCCLAHVARSLLFPAFPVTVNSVTMHRMMLWDFMIGFIVELLRLLLLEELSQHVRRSVTRLHRIRSRRRAKSFYRTLERNHKRQLLHKLTTRDDEVAS
jgi:hypothetical protein